MSAQNDFGLTLLRTATEYGPRLDALRTLTGCGRYRRPGQLRLDVVDARCLLRDTQSRGNLHRGWQTGSGAKRGDDRVVYPAWRRRQSTLPHCIAFRKCEERNRNAAALPFSGSTGCRPASSDYWMGLGGFTCSIRSLSHSPSATRMALASKANASIRLWDRYT